MKFALIDKIISVEPNSKIVAIKNLSLAEEYLHDHFPKFPVMPGVLILETITQAGGWLLRISSDFKHSVILLKEARAVRYKSFVSPGDTLRVECEIHKTEGDFVILKGNGFVGEGNVCSCKITLEQKNLADSHPDLAANDLKLQDHFKQMYNLIWKPTVG